MIVAAFGATASAAPDGRNGAGRTDAAGTGAQAERNQRTLLALAAGNPHRRVAASSSGGLPPASAAGITGVTGLATSAYAGKAKVNVYVPPVRVATYTYPYNRVPTTPFALAPRNFQPRNPNPRCNYYLFKLNTDLYAIDATQRDDKTPATIKSVGVFPDAKASMLAFGFLPATAVLHVRQVVRNGKIQPIYADQYSGGISIDKSKEQIYDNGGCDPDWETGQPYPLVSTGEVEARISDVEVDGRAVPVGDSCRTVTPLQLNLRGEDPDHGGKYYGVTSGGILYQRYDPTLNNSATNPLPLYPGSSDLTIPAFTGCRDAAGQDVSKVITALVSGPGSTVAVNQTAAVINSFDPKKPSLCYSPDDNFQEPHCVALPANVQPPAPGR